MFCGWRYKRSHEICPLVFADYSDEEGNYFCFEVRVVGYTLIGLVGKLAFM